MRAVPPLVFIVTELPFRVNEPAHIVMATVRHIPVDKVLALFMCQIRVSLVGCKLVSCTAAKLQFFSYIDKIFLCFFTVLHSQRRCLRCK